MKIKHIIALALVMPFMTSCHDWLTEQQPNQSNLDTFFVSGEAATQAINGCYVPLMWQFGGNYFHEWYIGDVASDDSIKGGQTIHENGDLFDIANYKMVPLNGLLNSFWNAQFTGIARCNQAIKSITEMSLYDDFDESLRQHLLGEAHFLRAYYYFRMVRMFGGVPMPLEPVTSSTLWKMPRETAETIYEQIFKDLTFAESVLSKKSEYAADDLGRATKGAAQAMLMKTNLYRSTLEKYGVYDTKYLDEVIKWGDEIIGSNEYRLFTDSPDGHEWDFHDQFLFKNDNNCESVFEIQFEMYNWSDWGGGWPGQQTGNMDVIGTRPRNTNTGGIPGWGYNKPSQDLVEEFEAGDLRKDYTVIVVKYEDMAVINDETHYGNHNCARKFTMETEDSGKNGNGIKFFDFGYDLRSGLNNREIRYADVYLMYAEAAIESGNSAATTKAEGYISEIRQRAGLADIANLDRGALRHERRCELALEGHRWFDLVRWGIAAQTMNAYRAKYNSKNPENKSTIVSYNIGGETVNIEEWKYTIEGDDMAEFIEEKHELMPIPYDQIRLSGIEQNNY